jgi:hypothetical protein
LDVGAILRLGNSTNFQIRLQGLQSSAAALSGSSVAVKPNGATTHGLTVAHKPITARQLSSAVEKLLADAAD